MGKGKFGMALSVYAVIGFILAALDQTVLCFVLLGFVMVAENNLRVSRAVAEAALLSTFHTAVGAVIDWIADAITSLFSLGGLLGDFISGGVSSVVSGVFGFFSFLLFVAVLVFAILAIANVLKGKDAHVPGISALVSRMFA